MQVDVLRDEAEQYAEKLKESDTYVELVRMKGHCHNSMLRLDLFDGTGDSGFDAKTTYQNIGAFLHKAFKSTSSMA
jgi:acetyl esterase/lipase